MDRLRELGRKKLFLVSVILAVALVATAVAAYSILNITPCTGPVCGPTPYPKIQSGRAQVGTYAPTNCELTTDVAVCSAYFTAGENGTVVIGISEMDATPGTNAGGIQVQLLVYSSDSQYVTFTSLPSCAHTGAPPLNTAGCTVSGSSPVPFTFGFSVSKDYPSYSSTSGSWGSSITVRVIMSCCWP